MSALTERIGHDHRIISLESTDAGSPDILCVCGTEGLTWSTYAAHVAEVTEAATRAAVAADIDTYIEGITEPWSDRMSHYLGGMYDARDIAEGKQP